MKDIIIRLIKGLFTNADPEDIRDEYAVELENMEPNNGRLRKTFGFGAKIANASSPTFKNLFTYLSKNVWVEPPFWCLSITPNRLVVQLPREA